MEPTRTPRVLAALGARPHPLAWRRSPSAPTIDRVLARIDGNALDAAIGAYLADQHQATTEATESEDTEGEDSPRRPAEDDQSPPHPRREDTGTGTDAPRNPGQESETATPSPRSDDDPRPGGSSTPRSEEGSQGHRDNDSGHRTGPREESRRPTPATGGGSEGGGDQPPQDRTGTGDGGDGDDQNDRDNNRNDRDEGHSRDESADSRPPEYNDGPPQGISNDKFLEASNLIKEMASHISDDIVIQGSRAGGTARPDSDIDIAIRVDEETFREHIAKSFKTPNPGSAKEKTMLHAIETGKIQGGEAKLRPLRRQLEKMLGIEVDVSIILQKGPFDNPPFIKVD